MIGERRIVLFGKTGGRRVIRLKWNTLLTVEQNVYHYLKRYNMCEKQSIVGFAPMQLPNVALAEKLFSQLEIKKVKIYHHTTSKRETVTNDLPTYKQQFIHWRKKKYLIKKWAVQYTMHSNEIVLINKDCTFFFEVDEDQFNVFKEIETCLDWSLPDKPQDVPTDWRGFVLHWTDGSCDLIFGAWNKALDLSGNIKYITERLYGESAYQALENYSLATPPRTDEAMSLLKDIKAFEVWGEVNGSKQHQRNCLDPIGSLIQRNTFNWQGRSLDMEYWDVMPLINSINFYGENWELHFICSENSEETIDEIEKLLTWKKG